MVELVDDECEAQRLQERDVVEGEDLAGVYLAAFADVAVVSQGVLSWIRSWPL